MVHDRFASIVERLITRHGRDVTLRKLSRTPEDGNAPWRGTDTDPGAGYEFEHVVRAAFIDFNEDEIDGDQVRRGDKRFLVAARPVAGTNLLEADSLLDEGSVYGIVRGNLLKPGTTEILYTFQVRA